MVYFISFLVSLQVSATELVGADAETQEAYATLGADQVQDPQIFRFGHERVLVGKSRRGRA